MPTWSSGLQSCRHVSSEPRSAGELTMGVPTVSRVALGKIRVCDTYRCRPNDIRLAEQRKLESLRTSADAMTQMRLKNSLLSDSSGHALHRPRLAST